MWLCKTIARSPALSSGMADSDEVQCPVEVDLPELEVRGGDRRGEAVVEGLGQMQRLVDAVPAQIDRDFLRPQLAGVEETAQLDLLEMRLAERSELRRPVLAHVPRVVGLLGAGRSQRQQVRRRDIDSAAGRQHRLEVLEDRGGVL